MKKTEDKKIRRKSLTFFFINTYNESFEVKTAHIESGSGENFILISRL